MADAAGLWYFAYGSNLDPRTFLGRRRMRPLETRRGLLRGWELRFDLPVGKRPSERAVANLRRRAGAHVWGVLYRLERREFARLDRTEGVHRGAYRREPVDVEPSDPVPPVALVALVAPDRKAGEGGALAAFTYVSERGRPGRKPSARYLGLLLAGARHHLLPEEWMHHLRGFELARDEREAGQLRLL